VGDFSATSGQKASFAKLGGIVGAECYYRNFNATVAFSFNPGDDDALLNAFHSGGGSGYAAAFDGSYSNMWIMAGYSYEHPLNEQFKLYGFGQVGLIYAMPPKMNYRQGNTTWTWESDNAAGFAWGLGVGVKINNQFLAGLRYYTAEPEYTQRAVGYPFTEVKTKLPCALFAITVGYMFQ
jgi:hypothetical protein